MDKIIDFGYNKRNYLDSSIEGVLNYHGKYLDIVSFKGKNYLITQSQSKKNYIYATEIIQDIYLDGTFVTYGNSYKSVEIKSLEYFFNSDKIKSKIKMGATPISLLLELGLSFKRPNIIPINDNKYVMVVIIRKDVFESNRNLLIKNRNKSFIELVNQNKRKIYKLNK